MKENRPKGLIIIELVAVKPCKSPDYSGWNGWQSIFMETEYGDAWVDKADENSQRLESYKAMTVSARRKIRSRSISTITHATEDDDIESQVRASLRLSPWNRRLRTKC